MNDEAPQGKQMPGPTVYGMDIADVLTHVWFDGFHSGASTGCARFLPADTADALADDMTRAAMESPELREQVRIEVLGRVQCLMEEVVALGQPIATGAAAAEVQHRIAAGSAEAPACPATAAGQTETEPR